MSYIQHALREFKAKGWIDEDGNYDDDLQELVCKNTLELLEVFGKQGYSGASFGYAVGLFSKLAHFKPLCPLTGEDSEWNEVDEELFQNNRYSSIFKRRDFVYNIDGRFFRYGEDGATFVRGWFSRTPVEFPYTIPKPQIVTLPEALVEKELTNSEFARALRQCNCEPFLCSEDMLSELGVEIL